MDELVNKLLQNNTPRKTDYSLCGGIKLLCLFGTKLSQFIIFNDHCELKVNKGKTYTKLRSHLFQFQNAFKPLNILTFIVAVQVFNIILFQFAKHWSSWGGKYFLLEFALEQEMLDYEKSSNNEYCRFCISFSRKD